MRRGNDRQPERMPAECYNCSVQEANVTIVQCRRQMLQLLSAGGRLQNLLGGPQELDCDDECCGGAKEAEDVEEGGWNLCWGFRFCCKGFQVLL